MTAFPTAFPELNIVLNELLRVLQGVLESDLVGLHLVGSFAVGDADFFSDCDFIAVIRQTPGQIRKLPCGPCIPTFPRAHINLEGTYAPVGELQTLDTLDQPWLFVDRGC
ncbi:hypothetical protein [Deinococcus alpinitundrae]|uniref:hypothetical protein n=1 Tax=Deinococcus alpinitundrae TaxID=468913 RepID=UPI00137A039D|nr:hypothetical protein [Deinococcus alpinitundrae]